MRTMRKLLSGLRVRLILLVLLALLPVFGLAFYDRYAQRQQSARAAQNHALEIAQRAVIDQRELIGAAHQLLLPLAQLEGAREQGPIPCSVLFDELLKHSAMYTNLGVMDARGDVVCAGVMPEQSLNLRARPYFARVLQQPSSVFGEFEIGVIAGAPTINFALPVVDDAQQVQGAVFASLNQTWFRAFADAQKMSLDSMLVLVERNNALGIRYPDLQVLEMRAWAPDQIAQWLGAPGTQRIVEIQDTDGVTRLYAFVPLSLEGYLGIGIPAQIVYAEIDELARRDVTLLILVTILALSVAWLYGDWFITRRVRAMLRATRQLEAGDLSARTDQAYGASELSELARAFDQMAATLQQRAAEQKNAVEALRQQAEEFATITQLSRQVSSVSDLNQVLTMIARVTAELAQSDASGVYIPDATGILRLVAGHGVSSVFIESLNAAGIRPNEGALGRAMIERRPIQVPDTNRGDDYSFSAAVRAEGIRAILAVPMMRDDRITGGIVLWHRQPRHFAPSEIAFLQAIAQQCVNAVENARLLQAEREARELAEALRDTAAALSGTLDFDELLDRILDNVVRVVPHDSVNIMLIEQECAHVVRARFNSTRKDLTLNERLVIAETPNLRQMVETGQAFVVEDTQNNPAWIELPETRWIRSHLGAPVCVKGKVIGFLSLDSATPNFFNATHVPRLQAFADQAALALENARLLTETEKRASYFAALSETARDIAVQQDLPALLEMAVERALKLLRVSHGGLYLYDVTQRDLELVVQKGHPVPSGIRLRLGEGMAGRVAQTQQPLSIRDYSHWEHRASQFTEVPFSTVLQVPLLYRGELIGVLSVAEVERATRQFTDEDTHLLSLFASQVAGAVHNTRLLQETYTRAEQLTLLYDAGLALNSILEPRVQLEYLLKIARRALKADCVSFFRYNVERGALEPELCIGYDAESEARWRSLSARLGDETNIPGWIATHRLPINLPEVSADPRYVPIDPQMRSGLWTPIEHEQQLLGVLGMLSARQNAFPPETERLLALFANQAAVALENARLFSEAQSSLLILTRLYNLSSQMLTAASVPEIAQLATEILRESFVADTVWLYLFSPEGEREFSYCTGADSSEYAKLTPRPEGLAAQMWRAKKPVVVDDPQRLHPVSRALGVQTDVALPLLAEPVNTGIVFLDYRTARSFSEREIDLLSLFANQVALAIKRVRLTTETQQRADQLTILNRVASAINQPARLDDLLHAVYREIKSAIPCDAFFIALYDPTADELDYRIQIDEDWVETPQRRILQSGLSRHVVKNRQPLLIRDREADTRFPIAPETLWGTMKHARSWLGVPILLGDAVVGIVSVQSYTTNTYGKEEEQLLVTIADQVAVAIQRARLNEETQQRLVELEAMNEISSALRAALTSREMLPALLDTTLRTLGATAGLVVLYDSEQTAPGEIVARGWFADITRHLPYSSEGIIGHVIATGEPHLTREFRTDPLTRELARAQIPSGWGGICTPICTVQGVIGALIVAVPLPRTIQPNEARLVLTIAEMAGNAIHRATLHEQTERHVRRLNALHTIDTAISASLDLRVTLNILLDQTLLQLGAHAADVLTLNPVTQTLEYAAGQGFRTNACASQRIHLGEGYSARAALEQRIVHHAELTTAADDPRAELLADEGFVTYYAAPLIAKGQFKGVLEIFQRAPHRATPEWLGFLDTLAGQTAIAIEIANLFTNLQRSNLELAVAYDSTIEGWSRVLDLRDRETEGHTQRVAELTMRLARALGMPEADLVNLRRGALLHDIGKMAIADQILLKKGRLTKAEMQKMRQHPQYANEMLFSIEYLRGALDIPYCHHERWDGTGYPRGLKGEEIPLSARIFAVVDVWDALRSQRPYRRAWHSRRVQSYLKAQAGTHFDPQVVETFLRMIKTDEIAESND